MILKYFKWIAVFWIEIILTIFFIDLTIALMFIGLFTWGVWQTFCVLGLVLVAWGLFDWFIAKEDL